MRLVAAASLALALALDVPAAAAQPIGTAPLAPNEVLFEVAVIGSDRSPADSAFVNLTYRAKGATSSEARAAAEALCKRLQDVGRRFGAEPVPLTAQGLLGGIGFAGAEITTTPGLSDADVEEAQPSHWGHGSMRLRLGDADRFVALRTALEEAGALNVIGPLYVLKDDRAAKRAARADALAQARAEAEAFARNQNMRVARLVRFSEASDSPAAAIQMMMNQFGGGTGVAPAEVETNIAAEVAFALAPQ